MKHLALYAIATVNTAPTVPSKHAAAPDRERKSFFRAALLHPFKAPRLDSREAGA